MGTADPFLGKLHVVSAVGNAVFGISDSGRGVVGISNTGYGVYGVSNFNEAGHFEGSVGITNKLSFGATTRQMINLWDTAYGIGVQGSTQYFRSFSHFGWYRGGVHHDAELNPGAGGVRIMYLDAARNLFTTGTMTPSSDRNMKENVSPINPRSILARVAAMPIQAWSYKADRPTVRHIGPMAQDFSAAFGFGADDKHIATVDADGVALASIQALYQMMLEKDKQIERLQVQLNRVQRTVGRRRAARR